MVNVESIAKELAFDGSGITKWLSIDASDETKKEHHEGGDHRCLLVQHRAEQ